MEFTNFIRKPETLHSETAIEVSRGAYNQGTKAVGGESPRPETLGMISRLRCEYKILQSMSKRVFDADYSMYVTQSKE